MPNRCAGNGYEFCEDCCNQDFHEECDDCDDGDNFEPFDDFEDASRALNTIFMKVIA